MHKSNEDCFYFLTSSCTKGALCTYRHSPLALTCNVVCPSWLRGNCLDPACPLRHSIAQRPMISNGILCFYENTPTGCLKLDCTFIHSRPRLNLANSISIRPSSVNVIKKDPTKSLVTNVTTPAPISQAIPITMTSNTTMSQPSTNDTLTIIPISTSESLSSAEVSPSIAKVDIVPRRISLPSDADNSSSTDNKISDNNSPNAKKSITRSVITDPSRKSQDDVTSTQSRIIVSRNVVISETSSVQNRQVVQKTASSSSNRIVVSSEKDKAPEVDLSEQENNTEKLKKDSQSGNAIEISISSSKSSTSTARSLFMSSTETMSNNDKKPVSLKRDCLPTTKPCNGTSSIPVTTGTSNEEKTSAGLTLLQDEERRKMRIERFQKKPTSPPRSTISSTSISTLNNLINNSVANERKRTMPDINNEDSTPAKRALTSLPSNQRKELNKQPDKSINGTLCQKKNLSSTTTPPPPHPSVKPSLINSRSASQLTDSSSLTQSSTVKLQIQQSLPVAIKRPVLSTTTSSQTSTEASQVCQVHTSDNKTSSPTLIVTQVSSNDEEHHALKLNESADIVDTFALIDEALLEADHLLELVK